VRFENVTVPNKNMLGKIDKGWPIVEMMLRKGAIAKCAESIGAIETCVCMGASVGMAKGAAEAGLHPVIAVIGDGSMTSGIAFEGLNQVGHIDRGLVVILNDNEMSISPNVGALSSYLNRLMTGQFVSRFRDDIKTFLVSQAGNHPDHRDRRIHRQAILLLEEGLILPFWRQGSSRILLKDMWITLRVPFAVIQAVYNPINIVAAETEQTVQTMAIFRRLDLFGVGFGNGVDDVGVSSCINSSE
jgi:hypothetical protein